MTTVDVGAATRVKPSRRPASRLLMTAAWHLGGLAVLATLLYPIGWVVAASFTPSQEILGKLAFLPAEPTFANYTNAAKGIFGISVVQFFMNSAILAVLSVVGTVFSSALTAYAFARLRFRGRTTLFAAMISTLLLPFHVQIIPQYLLYQKLELIDTYAPLLIGKFLAVEAFFVFLIVQFMRGLPYDLDEAAKIDGAGHWRIFWNIILPLSRPALITTAIFTFIWTWNDFFGPLIFLTTPEKYPLPLALTLFIDQQSLSDYGALIAMTMLSLLPVVLFFLVFQRYLVKGVATSGLAGG